MDDLQAKNLLRDTAKALADGGRNFYLILQTGNSFHIVTNQGSGLYDLDGVAHFSLGVNSGGAYLDYNTNPLGSKTIAGTVTARCFSSVILDCDDEDYTVWFDGNARSYLGNILGGDLLHLFAEDYGGHFHLSDTADILHHQRTTVLKG